MSVERRGGELIILEISRLPAISCLFPYRMVKSRFILFKPKFYFGLIFIIFLIISDIYSLNILLILSLSRNKIGNMMSIINYSIDRSFLLVTVIWFAMNESVLNGIVSSHNRVDLFFKNNGIYWTLKISYYFEIILSAIFLGQAAYFISNSNKWQIFTLINHCIWHILLFMIVFQVRRMLMMIFEGLLLLKNCLMESAKDCVTRDRIQKLEQTLLGYQGICDSAMLTNSLFSPLFFIICFHSFCLGTLTCYFPFKRSTFGTDEIGTGIHTITSILLSVPAGLIITPCAKIIKKVCTSISSIFFFTCLFFLES